MSTRRSLIAVLLAFACALAACTSSEAGSTGPSPRPSPSGSPTPPKTPGLAMRLAHVTGGSAGEHPHPADLAQPAPAVRRTIEDLYETAFLSPTLVRAALLSLFSGEARREATGDLAHLTLGAARSR